MMKRETAQDVLADEAAFLRMMREAAAKYEPKTELGKRIVRGWIGTFDQIAGENQSFSGFAPDALRKGLEAEREQLAALQAAVIKGHPDAESWNAFFSEDIAFAEELQALVDR